MVHDGFNVHQICWIKLVGYRNVGGVYSAVMATRVGVLPCHQRSVCHAGRVEREKWVLTKPGGGGGSSSRVFTALGAVFR